MELAGKGCGAPSHRDYQLQSSQGKSSERLVQRQVFKECGTSRTAGLASLKTCLDDQLPSSQGKSSKRLVVLSSSPAAASASHCCSFPPGTCYCLQPFYQSSAGCQYCLGPGPVPPCGQTSLWLHLEPRHIRATAVIQISQLSSSHLCSCDSILQQ